MMKPGNVSPRRACTDADVDEVLELGRAVAQSIEAKAYAGFEVVLPPDEALTHARLIRMGVDVEANMRAAREAMEATLRGDIELQLATRLACAAERRARSEARGATFGLWIFCLLFCLKAPEGARALATLIRGLF